MTNVEFVTRAYRHVISQEEQCTIPSVGSEEPICLYAGSNGNACAIGVFLPRAVAEALDEAEQGMPWQTVLQRATHDANARIAADCLAGVDADLAGNVQGAHDFVDTRDAEGIRQLRRMFAPLLYRAKRLDR